MLLVERLESVREHERRPVQRGDRETYADGPFDRDRGAGRDDHCGQQPEHGSRTGRDPKARQALGTADVLIAPLEGLVKEAQRERTQGTSVPAEVARVASARLWRSFHDIVGPWMHGGPRSDPERDAHRSPLLDRRACRDSRRGTAPSLRGDQRAVIGLPATIDRPNDVVDPATTK